MQNNTIEELIQLKQEGKIGWCELALRSEHGKDYLQWCDDHSGVDGRHPLGAEQPSDGQACV